MFTDAKQSLNTVGGKAGFNPTNHAYKQITLINLLQYPSLDAVAKPYSHRIVYMVKFVYIAQIHLSAILNKS
jgi:hypothetical protein